VILYHRNKTKKTAVIGMATGTAFVSIVAIFTNLFIIIPFYMTLMGQEMSYFIAMCTEANPLVQNAATLAIFGIIPFNVIKYSINSLGALVLYKRLSPILHGYGYTTYPAAKAQEADA